MFVESVYEDEVGEVRLRLGDEMTWKATQAEFFTIYVTIKAPALLADISRSVRLAARAIARLPAPENASAMIFE